MAVVVVVDLPDGREVRGSGRMAGCGCKGDGAGKDLGRSLRRAVVEGRVGGYFTETAMREGSCF